MLVSQCCGHSWPHEAIKHHPVLKDLPSTQETSQSSTWCMGSSLEHCRPLDPPSLFLGPGLVAPAADDQSGASTQQHHRLCTAASPQTQNQDILHPAPPPSVSQVLCPKPRASLGIQQPALPQSQHPAHCTCSLAGTCSPQCCCAASSLPTSFTGSSVSPGALVLHSTHLQCPAGM